MPQQTIRLGATPSGEGGDTNRSANVKCNENFTELYGTMAAKGDNSDITSLSGLTTPLSIEQGGTGANKKVQACLNIGAVVLGSSNESSKTGLSNSNMPHISGINQSGMDNSGPLQIRNGGNVLGSSVMTFHRVGQFACHFGLDTDNHLKVGGHSMGAFAYRIYHEGNTSRAADGTIKAL